MSLQWRHSGRDGVSDHQPHDCLLNRLFRHRSKKTSTPRVTGLCAGNSPVTGEFPEQRASNTENVSIWWRYHAFLCRRIFLFDYEMQNAALWLAFSYWPQILTQVLWINFGHRYFAAIPWRAISGQDIIWSKVWYNSFELLPIILCWFNWQYLRRVLFIIEKSMQTLWYL